MPRVLFALCFLLASEAWGQGYNYDAFNFRGLKRAMVNVEIDQTSKDCSLEQETLRNAIVLPINAYTKLQIAPFSPAAMGQGPTISCVVTALKNNRGCFFVYALEVQLLMEVTISDDVGARAQTVMLWRSGGLAISGLTDGGRYLTGIAEEEAKRLAIAWQGANPK